MIGKELVAMLSGQGANVRVVDMMERPGEFAPEVQYFRNDLSQHSQFLFRFEPEYVFHLAADFERSEETEEFWESNYKNNVQASHNLIKELKDKASLKKIIFASSYLIYDKSLYHNTRSTNLLNEDAKIEPRNLTGLAKLQTEMDLEFLSKVGRNKFSQASARIYRVYGKGSRDIISRWVRAILRGQEICVFDPGNRFDYIYAGDVAEGLLRMCTNKITGTYNLGFGQARAIHEVVDILKKELGQFKVKETNDSIFKESSQADMGKMKNDLGWTPQTSLEEGIHTLIAHEKANLR